MDFHEEEHYDHEEEEEEEEEVEGDEDDDDVDAARTTYENSLNNPTRVAEQATEVAAGGWGGGGQLAMVIMYKDCRKNHAVRIGKHAVDGCGEFLPSGPEGTLDALICAACTCHRNFHRKFQLPPPPSWYLRVGPTPARPLDDDDDDDDDDDNKGGGSSGKRHRTKFTEEQRERMVGLAEKLGWSIQKHDEAEVERFCSETGVGRQVLKVWMHNNKHAIGKKP